MGNFFGLIGMEKYELFVVNMNEIWLYLDLWNFYSVFIFCICMFVLFIFFKILLRILVLFIGFVIMMVIVMLFFLDVFLMIGLVYGDILSIFFLFEFFDMIFVNMSKLIGLVFVIVMFGGIELFFLVVVVDGMMNIKYNSNCEFIG